jgi:hypothetical protein
MVLREGCGLRLVGMFGITIRWLLFGALCRLIRRLVAPVANLNEKTFITHAGKMTPRNANLGSDHFVRISVPNRPYDHHDRG